MFSKNIKASMIKGKMRIIKIKYKSNEVKNMYVITNNVTIGDIVA